MTNAGALGVIPEPCLEAIAAGDGREVMKFDEDKEQNMHAYLKSDCDFAHSSSLCLACVIALQNFAILHGALAIHGGEMFLQGWTNREHERRSVHDFG